MAPGIHDDDLSLLPHREPSGTLADGSTPVPVDVGELAALRAASDHTGPLEIITPDMLSRVRDGLDAKG